VEQSCRKYVKNYNNVAETLMNPQFTQLFPTGFI
jgi:hypothetical protein